MTVCVKYSRKHVLKERGGGERERCLRERCLRERERERERERREREKRGEREREREREMSVMPIHRSKPFLFRVTQIYREEPKS